MHSEEHKYKVAGSIQNMECLLTDGQSRYTREGLSPSQGQMLETYYLMVLVCLYFALPCCLLHIRICMSYMEGGCNTGDRCVLQHPINSSPPRSSSSSNFSRDNLPYPALPEQCFPFSAEPVERRPQPSMGQPQHSRFPFENMNGMSGRLQTPPQSSFHQDVSAQVHRSPPATPQYQQGFW